MSRKLGWLSPSITRLLILAVLPWVHSACSTSRATAPDLTMQERFDLTVFRTDSGDVIETLWRYDGPLSIRYDGPEDFRQDVIDEAHELVDLIGRPVILDSPYPTLIVEISDRDDPANCSAGQRDNMLDVLIWSELPDWHIRQCIAQEMAQAIGPSGDLDGLFGSRGDTVFASYQTAPGLTAADRTIMRVLFDDRLYVGMPRERALATAEAIIAEGIDASQAQAGSAQAEAGLAELFISSAFGRADLREINQLYRWYRTDLGVVYEGPPEFRDDLASHMAALSEVTGLPARMGDVLAKLRVEIGDFDLGRRPCDTEITAKGARVFIRSDLDAEDIRQCIARETTQALGLVGDVHHPPTNGRGLVLSTDRPAETLTGTDLALLRILFDSRLWNGMPRERVLAVLPDIVADIESALSTASR